jgi:hypothetical protein
MGARGKRQGHQQQPGALSKRMMRMMQSPLQPVEIKSCVQREGMQRYAEENTDEQTLRSIRTHEVISKTHRSMT